MDAEQILIPKEQLAGCQIGDTLAIASEDETNFILEKQAAPTEEVPAVEGADPEMPAAIQAVMG